MLPCVSFEDEHLLVLNKPAGWNTHAPSSLAGEGIYDWLRHREPRWASLAIIHRLDKETSGVIVFSKTPLANRSLTDQFTRRAIQKTYLLVTDRAAGHEAFTVRSALVRTGDKYRSRPQAAGAVLAETRFTPAPQAERILSTCNRGLGRGGGDRTLTLWQAEPLTGRTHQIRVHAADQGLPILGDLLYGGTPAPRLYLHAARLVLRHPATGVEMCFEAPADFGADTGLCLRTQIIESDLTDTYRLVHGASDGQPGWYLERYADYLLSQSEATLTQERRDWLEEWRKTNAARGVYHKSLSRQMCRLSAVKASPQLVLGAPAPERFRIRENGLRFELSFSQGYSVGLFLDQRDNRRRLLTGHVAAGFQLYPTVGQASCLSPDSALRQGTFTGPEV